MLIEISLFLGGCVLGGIVVAAVFAFDKMIVRLHPTEVVIDKSYYDLMKVALGKSKHMMVLRQLAVDGRIPAGDVKEEDDDEEYNG